ncbi:FKBP-type peptidyl-prolyl cis-trans isomerase [Streptomyces canus]
MSIDKPEIDFPGGEPPADLEIKDIWEGDGEVAQAGQTVTVHYVGVAFSTGEEFDASWNRGQPFRFPLGGGRVIKGWDQGVQGMKVGRPSPADHSRPPRLRQPEPHSGDQAR